MAKIIKVYLENYDTGKIDEKVFTAPYGKELMSGVFDGNGVLEIWEHPEVDGKSYPPGVYPSVKGSRRLFGARINLVYYWEHFNADGSS